MRLLNGLGRERGCESRNSPMKFVESLNQALESDPRTTRNHSMNIWPFTLSSLALAASVASAQPTLHSVQPLGNNQACAAISPQAAQSNIGGQTCASALAGYIDRFNTGKFQINRGCPAGTTLSGFSNITCQDIIQPNGRPQANFNGQGCCVAPQVGQYAPVPPPPQMTPTPQFFPPASMPPSTFQNAQGSGSGSGLGNHPSQPNATHGPNRGVSRHQGATTPTLSDFGANDQANFAGAHYDDPAGLQDFLETLPLRCPAHTRPTNARLTLQLTKLHPVNAPGRISFMDNGGSPLGASIWSNAEPVGSVKTVTLNLNALPGIGTTIAPGVKITHNGLLGNADRLIQDRDLSFKVSKNTMVRQATLIYQCGTR